MKIFRSADIKLLDAYTIKHEPISSLDLMERAATAITGAIAKRWNKDMPVKVFAGPGNNGGDALAVARLLAEQDYQVEAYLFNTTGTLSEECQANKELLEQLDSVKFIAVTSKFSPPTLKKGHLIIDGLFGSGLNKPLAGGFAAMVRYINASEATVVSIDMPSGLMGENNVYNVKNHIIRADVTLSLQLPKLAFLFAENEEYLGEWELLDINLSKEGIANTYTAYSIVEEQEVKEMIKPRKRFSHKGNYGHALLIAGSYGMAGASVLAGKACLHSGVGLLTIHAPIKNNDILQTSVPEAIVQHDIHDSYFALPVDTENYQAVGIGPGLGQAEETEIAVIEQLDMCKSPMVIDADALNILSNHRNKFSSLPKDSILTPHPKEMDRLVGTSQDSYERLTKAIELAFRCKVYIILKGAYSTVITPDGKCIFNPTGNPGMATGGSGDTLTGVLLSLLAQGYTSLEACIIGTYVHGLAGDIAASKFGEYSLTAGDIIGNLPEAWAKLR